MEAYVAAIIGVLVFVVGIVLLLILAMICWTLWMNDFPRRPVYVDTEVELYGKTAIVTGSSKGIGAVCAKELARRGARVILAVRNIRKTEPIRDNIIKETKNDQVVIMQVDLSDLESVHKFCSEFIEKEKDLHILINNAGLGASNERTKQGFNMVMSVNYVGPFLLTHLLLGKLKQSAPSRIVTVTSHTIFNVDAIPCINRRTLDLTEWDAEGNPLPNLNDKRDSRLYGVMMMLEMSRRLKDEGVTCYSVAPGMVHTSESSSPLSKALMRDEWTGSQTVIYCAVQEGIEADSGALFDNCRIHALPKLAKHDNVVRDLYDATPRVIPGQFLVVKDNDA